MSQVQSEKLFKSRWRFYQYVFVFVTMIMLSIPFLTGHFPITFPSLSILAIGYLVLIIFFYYFIHIPKGKYYAFALTRKRSGMPNLDIKYCQNSFLINPFCQIEAIMDLRPRVLKYNYSFPLPGRKLGVKIAFECVLNTDAGGIIDELNRQKKPGVNIDEILKKLCDDFLQSKLGEITSLFGNEGEKRALNGKWKEIGEELQNHLQSQEKNYTFGEITFMQPYMQMHVGMA